MLDLQPVGALVDDEDQPLGFANNDIVMRAVTNFYKVRLQIFSPGKWNQAKLEQNLECQLFDSPNQPILFDPKAFWVSPNAWLLASSKFNSEVFCQKIQSALQKTTFALTDETARFSIIELEGKNVRELLMAGCGIDLHYDSCQPHHYRLTGLAGLPIILYCHQSVDIFWVIADTREVRYLWDWLEESCPLISMK